jgi:hypothetical protein
MILPNAHQFDQSSLHFNVAILANAQENDAVKNSLNTLVECVGIQNAPVLWMLGDVLRKLDSPLGEILKEGSIEREFSGSFFQILLLKRFNGTGNNGLAREGVVKPLELIEIRLIG